ncbi:MAG: nitroreductase [Gammaproteobacteria bacterium]|nr:nitroreductase [Gammaproteobacteria bacterium]
MAHSTNPYALIKGLRAVRQFTSDPIPDRDVDRILEAGRWTGSAKNTQRWAFVPLRDKAARETISACGNYTAPLRNATFGIALIRLPDGYEFDIGRVAQNMMLAAAALGIASCPVTLHDGECSRRILDLPDGHVCRYAIAFGYEDPERERISRSRRAYAGRKPMSELIWEFPR